MSEKLRIDAQEAVEIERYLEELAMARLCQLADFNFKKEIDKLDLPPVQVWEQCLPLPYFNID